MKKVGFILLVLSACADVWTPNYLTTENLPADFEVQEYSYYGVQNGEVRPLFENALEMDEIYLCYKVLSDTDINVDTPKEILIVKHLDDQGTNGLMVDHSGDCPF